MDEKSRSVHQLIRASTKKVVERARSVRINPDQIRAFTQHIPARLDRPPAWDTERHFSDRTARTAQWVFVLDALNFSFWPDREQERWRVAWRGEMVKGYWALACSLKRALQVGVPITDAPFLEGMDVATLGEILAGEGVVPMIEQRVVILNEIGRLLGEQYDGSFANLLEEAGGSAARTVTLVTGHFPSFYDVSTFEGEKVYFFKRAQILVSDVWGAFHGTGLGQFQDLSCLTAFADYKLPQLLRALGILEYAPSLADRVDNLIELPAGSREEVEIRAATIWAVEEIRHALATAGRQVDVYAIDWWLWDLSHVPEHERRPHHRTRTIFY